MAHWFFAFSYLVLSYRIELTVKKLPKNNHNCWLNTVNIIVCLFNVALPAIVWIYYARKQYYVAEIAGYVGQMILVVSCVVLVFGISRLARIVQS